MNSPSVVVPSMVIRDSRFEPAARCLVCGAEIAAGQGLTARYGQRTLRFKCSSCISRFEADPERYLADHEAGCCRDEPECSPASEWRCD